MQKLGGVGRLLSKLPWLRWGRGGGSRGAEKGVREQTNPRQKTGRGKGRPPSQLGGLVQRSEF